MTSPRSSQAGARWVTWQQSHQKHRVNYGRTFTTMLLKSILSWTSWSFSACSRITFLLTDSNSSLTRFNSDSNSPRFVSSCLRHWPKQVQRKGEERISTKKPVSSYRNAVGRHTHSINQSETVNSKGQDKIVLLTAVKEMKSALQFPDERNAAGWFQRDYQLKCSVFNVSVSGTWREPLTASRKMVKEFHRFIAHTTSNIRDSSSVHGRPARALYPCPPSPVPYQHHQNAI